jgi:hypothetical protein
MIKQYVYHNTTTDEVVGFNANSLHQSKIRMRRLSRVHFIGSKASDWKFVKTDKKMRH